MDIVVLIDQVQAELPFRNQENFVVWPFIDLLELLEMRKSKAVASILELTGFKQALLAGAVVPGARYAAARVARRLLKLLRRIQYPESRKIEDDETELLWQVLNRWKALILIPAA